MVLAIMCIASAHAFEQYSTTALSSYVVTACTVQSEKFTVTNTGTEPSFVHFSVHDESKDFVNLEPKSAFLGPGEEVVVNSFIHAPCGSQGDYKYNLYIEANAITFETARTLSIVNPNNLLFAINDAQLESCACQTQKVYYAITNPGTFPETYSLTANNKAVSIAEKSFFIAPGKTYSGIAYVTYPCDEKGVEKFTLTARATSSEYEAKIPVQYTIDQCYDQSLQTKSKVYQVCPQDHVVHINVTNLGLAQDIALLSSSDIAIIQQNITLAQGKSASIPVFIDAKRVETASKITVTAVSTKDLAMVDKLTFKVEPLQDAVCYGLSLVPNTIAVNNTNQTLGLTLVSTGNLPATYNVVAQGQNWTTLTTKNVTVQAQKNATIGLALAPVFVENGTYDVSIIATTNDFTQRLPLKILVGEQPSSVPLLFWIFVLLVIILLLLIVSALYLNNKRQQQIIVIEEVKSKKQIEKERKLSQEEKRQKRAQRRERAQALKKFAGWVVFSLLIIIILLIVYWFVGSISWNAPATNHTNQTNYSNYSNFTNTNRTNIANLTNISNITNTSNNATNISHVINLSNASQMNASQINVSQTNATNQTVQPSFWSRFGSWFKSLFTADNQSPSNLSSSNVSITNLTNVTTPTNVTATHVSLENITSVVNQTNLTNQTVSNISNVSIGGAENGSVTNASNITNFTNLSVNTTQNVTNNTNNTISANQSTPFWPRFKAWLSYFNLFKPTNQTTTTNVTLNQTQNVSANMSTNMSQNVSLNVTANNTVSNNTLANNTLSNMSNQYNQTNQSNQTIQSNQSAIDHQKRQQALVKVKEFVANIDNTSSVRYLFIHENKSQTVNLSHLFKDPEGDQLVFDIETINAFNITFALDGESLQIIPDNGYIGIANFTIIATDSQGLSTRSPVMWVIVGHERPTNRTLAISSLVIASAILIIIIALVVYFDFKLLSLAYKKESQVSKKIGKKKR
ncbi:MAG TPA: hypothetical protein VK158_00485 [Acidobacteriota bacterium]|nr:hypothetical protein [Acidobacteriota bacterium]